MLAPICLFTYDRLECTKKTVASLQHNYLAVSSDLIIFSDQGKTDEAKIRVKLVRDYIRNVNGFRSVTFIESPYNKGLAESIISGVTQVIEKYGTAIVLEDDLVTKPNFLSYMNQCLEFYKNDERIISICGYGLKIKKPLDYHSDVYLYSRSSSWGWATWRNRWEVVDWDINDWLQFKNDRRAIRSFNENGSDMFSMLRSVKEGQGKSWAIRFCYSQFKRKQYSVMPFNSLVENIGFMAGGTNTHFKYSRFKTNMDNGLKQIFLLAKDISPDKKILKSCYRYHSLPIRIYSRIRYILNI